MIPSNHVAFSINEKKNDSLKSELVKLFALYFVANIFLLLNTNGIYWDDWTLFNHTYNDIVNTFTQAVGKAGYITGNLHYHLLSVGNSVYYYRIATFFLLFASALFVYAILKTIKELNRQDVFFLTLFFLIAPVYDAKVALINFPYTFFYFIFFLSFYITSIYTINKNSFLRIIILLLFFLSFLINSLLVFYAIVIFYLFYFHIQNHNNNIRSNIKTFIIHNLDFLTLPILFFILKSIYFSPSYRYTDYNAITLKGLLTAPILSLKAFYASFIIPIEGSISLIGVLWLSILFYLLYTKFKTSKIHTNNQIISNKYDSIFLFLGGIFFFLGVFAYCAVGKLPENDVWNSRLQLLVPLGFAFILYFSLLILSRKFQFNVHAQKALLYTIIVAFMAKNLYQDYRYNLDWFYTVSIEENFKNSPIINQNSTFIITTSLTHELANNRTIRYYEYNGMLRKIFKNDDKLMLTSKEQLKNIGTLKPFRQYNFSSWRYSEPILLSIVPNPEYKLKRSKIIKLFYYRLFDTNKFHTELKNLILLHVIKG